MFQYETRVHLDGKCCPECMEQPQCYSDGDIYLVRILKKYRCFIDVSLRLCNNKYVAFGFEFV